MHETVETANKKIYHEFFKKMSAIIYNEDRWEKKALEETDLHNFAYL